MTVHEAIRIQSMTAVELQNISSDKLFEAQRLSYEALKRLQYLRRYSMIRFDTILPGETLPQSYPEPIPTTPPLTTSERTSP